MCRIHWCKSPTGVNIEPFKYGWKIILWSHWFCVHKGTKFQCGDHENSRENIHKNKLNGKSVLKIWPKLTKIIQKVIDTDVRQSDNITIRFSAPKNIDIAISSTIGPEIQTVEKSWKEKNYISCSMHLWCIIITNNDNNLIYTFISYTFHIL